jgi:hypothetical protein
MEPGTLRRLITVLGGAGLAIAVWWFVGSAAPAARARAGPSNSEIPRAGRAAPITASVAAARNSTAPDPESLLHELEALAVNDKPRALAVALSADDHLPAAGVLAEARRAFIVTLLVDLQRMSEARERAREFTRSYPTSRYVPLVQGVTGVHPRPRPSELRDARR